MRDEEIWSQIEVNRRSCPEGKARGALTKRVVDQDEAGHGFHQGDGARQHARVVASAAFELDGVAVTVHGGAGLKDRCHGLESDAKQDVFAVADAALDAAASVGGGADSVTAIDELVVVLGAAHQRAAQSGAQFEGFRRGEGPHGLGEVGVEAVKDRFAPARRHAAGHEHDGAPDRVAGLFHVRDAVRHAGGRLGMWAPHGVGVDLVTAVKGRRQGHADVLDALDVGADLDAEGGEDLACDRTGHHARDRFPCRSPAAAADIAEPVFGLVREVRMGGTERVFQVIVVGRAGGRVGDREPDGRACGDRSAFVLDRAGQPLHLVGFLAGRGQGRLARTSARELVLHCVQIQRKARWTPVHDAAHGVPMRLAKRRQSEKGAKGVSCHALRRYTLHVMRTLVKNIKGLVGAFEEVPRDVAGSEMAKFPILHNAWLALEEGVVVDFGGMEDFPGIVDWSGLNIVDAEGRWVLPAWCDSHTHTVFARSRSEEFLMRLEGATYQEIAERGGGILNSAKALQAMGEDELFEDALKRVHRAISQGVGAMEIKSGYGLTLEAERKMLRVIARLKEVAPIPIKATFLGCHAVPPEFENAAAYTQHVVTDMLPAFAAEGLVDYVDVFCEKGYFGVNETHALLEAANDLGLKSKVHVNQFNDIGGVELCVNQHALSVDHLEVCGSEAIQSLIEGFERAEDGDGAPTYPVALPGCSHFLSIPYTPGRAIIDAGLPLVLATDHNPGSAPSGDMSMAVRLASLKMGVLPREAVAAATLNGAAAMELSHEVGALGRGHRANFIVTHPMEGLQDIAYRFTDAVVDKVFINGEIWEG